MMGIYLPNMEMPKNCAWCRFLQSTDPVPKRELFCGIDTTNNIHDYKPDKGCPLVSVPPHGRLIDADALEDDDPDVCNSFMRDGYVESCEWGYSHKQIKNAPTIIPAEEGE